MKLQQIIIVVLVCIAFLLGYLLNKSYSEARVLSSDLFSIRSELTSKKELIDKQYSIDNCLKGAYTTYKEDWVAFCKLNKIKIKNEDCSIPVIISNEFDKEYREEKALCINRYK